MQQKSSAPKFCLGHFPPTLFDVVYDHHSGQILMDNEIQCYLVYPSGKFPKHWRSELQIIVQGVPQNC